MSRSRDLANLAGDATGLETLTVSDITDLTATATELNYVDGVTSAVQTQLTQLDSQTSPHIIPGVLYPAVGGNDLSGTALGGSYVYGTAHTDNRKYYYTDIKGSKPIKDPRIGGHFGSQRHKFKSKQLLEQETATHGSDVHSVDGREWVRLVGANWTIAYNDYSTGGFQNDSCNDSTTEYFEVVAYCNALNFISFTATTYGKAKLISIDGSADTTTQEGFASVSTPLGSRYVDAGSVIPLKTATLSLGIHTFRIGFVDNVVLYGIELIAQDTSNRNNIQIPSQNVVSYGKKFTVSGTPHYDPFNGFTSGSSVTSYIDTATSLGVENWKHSSTYYRPYNGGRVVRWVDSSGVIKTSVTLMPPNAQNFGGTAITAKANASVANDTYLPTFSGAIDDSLSEVAKTFIPFEFGNGSANEGTGGANYADASMLSSTADDVAYVMDDGLSSFSGNDVKSNGAEIRIPTNLSEWYYTFIGTGISLSNDVYNFAGSGDNWTIEIDGVSILASTTSGSIPVNSTFAQNLPYGTHVFHIKRTTGQGAFEHSEVTFHQPKRPPIPEDAVVLCDYMLLADFVGMPTSDSGQDKISKGVRACSVSRDVFYEETDGDSAFTLALDVTAMGGYKTDINGSASSATACTMRLPAFATNYVVRGFQMDTRASLYIGSTDKDSASTKNSESNYGSFARLTNNEDLGVQNWGVNSNNAQAFAIAQFEFVSPIHTSHHYQPFETPFLHELVGGDRNMEQTNLVCSPDGKTWDQITRDTSYMGNSVLFCRSTSTYSSNTSLHILDEWRGVTSNNRFHNKDFAIAYDRIICLKDGEYNLVKTAYHSGSGDKDIFLNGGGISRNYGTANDTGVNHIIIPLKRGDYIQVKGVHTAHETASLFQISKL